MAKMPKIPCNSCAIARITLLLVFGVGVACSFVVEQNPHSLFRPRLSSLHLTSPATAEVPTTVASKEALIQACKTFLDGATGFYGPLDKPELMAEDFVMRGPAIGPLIKNDYIDTMSQLKIYEAFPDIRHNAFGFSVDPSNPNKVWFFVRNTATNTGPISFGDLMPTTIPPSGNSIQGPTEAFSMEFNEQMQLRGLTIGYPANRFEGNTGGLGAFIGLLKGSGLSLPKTNSWVFKLSQKLFNDVPGAAKTYSNPEDLPDWWKSKDVLGADGL